MSRSLPLLLLLSLLAVLRAEPPASPPASPTANDAAPPAAAAEEVPAPFRVDPNFVDPIPSTASLPPPPPSPPTPDKEIDAIRGLLEAAGLRVTELFRNEEGEAMALGKARLASSPDPRQRDTEVLIFVLPPTSNDCWLISFALAFDEQPRPAEAQAKLRSEAARLLAVTDFLRLGDKSRAGRDEDPDEPSQVVVFGRHIATSANPAPLAVFLSRLMQDLRLLMELEDEEGLYLATKAETEERPIWLARSSVARRLRERLKQGLSAAPAPAGPATEDPASHASHLVDASLLNDVERAGKPLALLDDIGHEPRPIPSTEAFRLFLEIRAETNPEAVDALRVLAFDPATGAPRDAWALHFWACHLIHTLPEEGRADQVVEALDTLRMAARLGCERSLAFYLNILSHHDEPLVGGESHWEQRTRWEALFPHFDPHFPEESLEVERDYRAGDRSPIRIGVEAEGEELRQIRLAVEEMNTARRARGWKTFEVVVETPALEPVGEDAKKTDPAGAGSGEG